MDQLGAASAIQSAAADGPCGPDKQGEPKDSKRLHLVEKTEKTQQEFQKYIRSSHMTI